MTGAIHNAKTGINHWISYFFIYYHTNQPQSVQQTDHLK